MNIWTEPTTGMEFVWIPAGKFQMRDQQEHSGGKRATRDVTLDGFWMGKYPVTQGQWKCVMGANPSDFREGDDYPVENVSWNDTQEFIAKLQAGDAVVFRLPTEAEWEYAARSGGKREIYAGGDDVGRVAWYADNSAGHTHAVGQKAPNGLGLYDMCGNVSEWCVDWYKEDACRESPTTNPTCKDDNSGLRVLRGGSWNYCDGGVRCEVRGRSAPNQRFNDAGFRLVCLFQSQDHS